MLDAKHWNWAQGFCEKHRGQSLPCQMCIETGDFVDDTTVKGHWESNVPSVQNIPKHGDAAMKESQHELWKQFIDSRLGEPYMVDEVFVPGNKNPCGEIFLTPQPSPEVVANQNVYDAITRATGNVPSPELVTKVRRLIDEYSVEGGKLIAQSPVTDEEAKAMWAKFQTHYDGMLRLQTIKPSGEPMKMVRDRAEGIEPMYSQDHLKYLRFKYGFIAPIQGSSVVKTFYPKKSEDAVTQSLSEKQDEKHRVALKNALFAMPKGLFQHQLDLLIRAKNHAFLIPMDTSKTLASIEGDYRELEMMIAAWMLDHPGQTMTHQVFDKIKATTDADITDFEAMALVEKVKSSLDSKREDLGGTHCPKCDKAWGDCGC